MAPDISSTKRRWARWNANGGRALALALLVLVVCIYPTLAERAWERLNLRNLVFDYYQRLSPRQLSRLPVVVVDIDDESLAAFGRWPWPRTRLARLVDATYRLGARAIGLDIIMPEPDDRSPQAILAEHSEAAAPLQAAIAALPSNDAILAATLRRVPSVIGRAGTVDPKPRDSVAPQSAVVVVGESPNQFINDEQRYAGQLSSVLEIDRAARGSGYLNDSRDRDGIIRRMPILMTVQDKIAPSMALDLVRVANRQRYYQVRSDKSGITGIQIGEFFAPLERDGRLRLHFSAARELSPVQDQRRVSALKILRGEVPPNALTEQIAIIGVTAVAIGDVAATPVAARADGVEIHAQTVENLLLGTRLKRPPAAPWLEALTLLALGLVLIVAFPSYGPLRGAVIFFAGALLLFLASYGSFHWFRELYDPTFPLAASSAIVLLLLIAGFSEAQGLRRESEAALELARHESLKVAGELRAAGKIQKGLLPDPRAIEALPSALDFFAMLEPAEEVGGDLYDAFMLDQHRLCFMIGDVSDKGVPASLFMAVTKALCKSLARRDAIPLDRLLRTLNSEVSRDNPESMFVSAIIGIADSRSGAIEFCNAGHPAPIVLRPGHPAAALDDAGGPPLCIDEDFIYVSQRVTLGPGATLLLVTDGVTEAQNRAGDCYGSQRLLAFASAHATTAESVCEKLYEEVNRFTEGAPLADDLTIVAVRFTPTAVVDPSRRQGSR